jgi:carotenoid 1,2-hydratase
MDVYLSTARSAHADPRSLSGRRQHPPGAGHADGGAGRLAGIGSTAARPRFDVSVKPNGYHWWYIDGMSDDGRYGIVIIAFLGSVFSPYYRAARKFGAADPANHCAINVALYGKTRRWAMTEHSHHHMDRDAERFQVGRSMMRWEHDALVIDIDECCAFLPYKLRGQVTLTLGQMFDETIALDAAGRHKWRAEADFEAPRLSWSGIAYHDMNWGEEPLEDAFEKWTWQRSSSGKQTQVLYKLIRRDGTHFSFGRNYGGNIVQDCEVPIAHKLKRGLWGMDRVVLSEQVPRLLASLEDAPFYTRNYVQVTLNGEKADAFHESVSLPRFCHPAVQWMLPYRMLRF